MKLQDYRQIFLSEDRNFIKLFMVNHRVELANLAILVECTMLLRKELHFLGFFLLLQKKFERKS